MPLKGRSGRRTWLEATGTAEGQSELLRNVGISRRVTDFVDVDGKNMKCCKRRRSLQYGGVPLESSLQELMGAGQPECAINELLVDPLREGPVHG